ncbi:MAG: multicopper oxidase domain-containing protein [Acidobacteria bacterium]|nr:multicopper oxidase domain-containing protein [Acidobacteriota bacterium]
MAKISKARLKAQENARKNRQELIGVSRRDLMKMGLLTSAGLLVPKRGLSARALNSAGWLESGSSGDDIPCQSPPTTPFIEELPNHMNGGMVIHSPVAAFSNEAACPAQAAPSGCPNDGRTQPHQAFAQRPPVKKYEVSQRRTLKSVHPALPLQPLWGFARRQVDGAVDPNTHTGVAWTPGPTFVARYNEAVLVRNFNDLPPPQLNDGFGLPSVVTHLHNGHTPSESDGFPCDYFERGQFYDQHYPNVLAGINSTHPGTGDINESLSTLWYHDHRIEFTAPNVYKGLAGFYILFNELDTGDENTGFKLPSFPQFDIPLIITDRSFSPETGLLCFDMFSLDGVLGDRFLVNGKIQPFFNVQPRRYRFRVLDGGPSRFYQNFLLDPTSPSTINKFWHIANDGNLLPRPLLVNSIRLGVAERHDIIIDFRPFAGKTLYLENRLEQQDGRGPTNNLLPPGQGHKLLKFIVGGTPVPDGSADPSTQTFYPLPPRPTPRITRTFRFDRTNGQWAINNKLMPGDCSDIRFRVQRNSGERWILQNNSGGWQHPIHIHFEEFQLVRRNSRIIQAGDPEFARKDVVRLNFNEEVELLFRFRDFRGRYPMHCHNTLHEDHAMMLRFDIEDVGDNKTEP